MKITAVFGWIFHWFFQGLKMWFFLLIPIIVWSFFNSLGLVVYNHLSQEWGDGSLVIRSAIIGIQIIFVIIGIAVSTYYFADQLDCHPFRKYGSKRTKSPAQ